MGQKCNDKLELVPITCNLHTTDGPPCDSMKTFDLGTCNLDPNQKIKSFYTFTFSNKGKRRAIKFFTGINPGKPKNRLTFARANLKEAAIQRGKKLKPGSTREYIVTRTLKPCSEPRQRIRFVAEIVMNGFVAGFKQDQDYACKVRDFYSHHVHTITSPPSLSPTEAPTASPTNEPTTEAPTASPTNAPTVSPTKTSTASPTNAPTATPTEVPTVSPTNAPTSSMPTETLTVSPTTNAPTATEALKLV